MKHNATMFWLDAYEMKLNEELNEFKIPLPTTKKEWYERCREWLITAGGRRLWEKDMVWGKNKSDPETYNHLYAFRFQLGLRNYRTPTDHMRSAQLMRHIAARYSQFNVTTFHEYYPFADQYIELKPALIRNCILALISMLLVSFVMIPNYGAAFAIAGAICSIDLGLIGYMTFWGVRLESVSMITVIMSIGFAVDLSAHIGYAYVKAHGDRNKKAIQALETIGWPVFLGALSTVLGILVLVTVDAYIVQIFFKTIFLVIVFSMMHGLIFLPVLLTVILPHAKDRDVEDEVSDNHIEKNTSGHRDNALTNENKKNVECISANGLNMSEIDLSDCKDSSDDQKVIEVAGIEWIEESQGSESIVNERSINDEIQFADDASEDSDEDVQKRSEELEDETAAYAKENDDRGYQPHLEHPKGDEIKGYIANNKADPSYRQRSIQIEEDKRRMLEVESFKDAKRLAAINDSNSGVSV
uniref:Patched domain-containing protein 3 n=1 Tax=Ascaris suum TaxID=6253 RepID=F1L6B1_ASCSU